MYAALFELNSYRTEQYIVRGSSAAALLDAFEDIQSLECLVRMGRSHENAKGQKMLDKLEAILNKRYSGELTSVDLLGLDITLSVGTIKCVEILVGDDAADRLKAKYPKARG